MYFVSLFSSIHKCTCGSPLNHQLLTCHNCWPIGNKYCLHLLPGGSVVKNPRANAGDSGDVGLIPVLGRSPPGDLLNPRIKPRSLHCRQILYHLSHLDDYYLNVSELNALIKSKHIGLKKKKETMICYL